MTEPKRIDLTWGPFWLVAWCAWCLGCGIGGAALVASVLFATLSGAHEFYTWDCCSDRDCGPVERSMVIEGPNGYEIPSLGQTVPYGDERHRVSPDGDYHLCISPTRGLVCIYAPLGGT